jgi:RHS repeat-associated protein
LSNDLNSGSGGFSITAFSEWTGPSGKLSIGSGGQSLTFAPAANWYGDASFVYTIVDGYGGGASAVGRIHVTRPPVATADSYEITPNSTLYGNALTNDSDPDDDTLTASLVDGPSHGTATVNSDGSFSFTPDSDYHGEDSFTYEASDGVGGSSVATVNIIVNTAPVAVDDSFSTGVNIELSGDVLTNDSDADGDTLTAAVVDEPEHGTVTLNTDGTFLYTPDEDYHGSDSFTYRATDPYGAHSQASVITITVNTPPVGNSDSFSTRTGGTITGNVLANDSDPNGDNFSATISASPSHGTVSMSANGDFIYTPDTGFSGSDSFNYMVLDEYGGYSNTDVYVDFSNVNPVAVDNEFHLKVVDAAHSGASFSFNVLGNDTDADGDSLIVSGTFPDHGDHGSVSMSANGTFYYTPDTGYLGKDRFQYTANDGHGGTSTAWVYLVIANPLPAETISTTDGTLVSSDNVLSGGETVIAGGSIRASDGVVDYGSTDLSSDALGESFGVTRNWTNDSGAAGSAGTFGSNWTDTQTARLTANSDASTVAIVLDGTRSLTFNKVGSDYILLGPGGESLVHDSGTHRFILQDTSGRLMSFYDFDSSIPLIQQGQIDETLNANGLDTTYTYDSSHTGHDGRLLETVRKLGSSWESLTYTYAGSGINADRVTSIVLQSTADSGSDWNTIRSVSYTYYATGDSYGTPGDLKTATIKDASGNSLNTEYYRYYGFGESNGFAGALKFVFSGPSYDLLAAAGTPTAMTDTEVAPYADSYYEYVDSDSSVNYRRVVLEYVNGQGEYDFVYSKNEHALSGDMFNQWANKTVENLPNAGLLTIYTNVYGQMVLSSQQETSSSSQKWDNYYHYDAVGGLLYHATPSAVSGFNETKDDLVDFEEGNAVWLRDDIGVFEVNTFGISSSMSGTIANDTTPGDAVGYLKSTSIQHGESGTPIKLSDLLYESRTTSTAKTYWVTSSTQYRNDDGTGAQTTTMVYAWADSSQQLVSVTTILPIVTTEENGPNVAASMTTVYDANGRPVWTRDAAGIIGYTEYDPATGAVVKTIADVDTTLTTEYIGDLPTVYDSGTDTYVPWATLSSGAGLNLISTFEVDALGRTTKSVDPLGHITYTVYNDADHEVRVYAGWNTTTNLPTGPITVIRENRVDGYTETLTMSATPSAPSGVPTGTEGISDIQSLSRSYYNDAGQVTHTDDYFHVPSSGDANSASFGTLDTDFYRTSYSYDELGQLNKTVTDAGTITRTEFDGLGRMISIWVGTDDSPTSGVWSTSNLTGTNMVKVSSTEYDNGGVGESNITKTTLYPTGDTNPRVTETWYDWQNRPVLIKAGVESSESTDVHRPISYVQYDNLGEVISSEMYDGDAVTITSTDGVPDRPDSKYLRSKTDTNYDELNRAYETFTYSVDPSDGTSSASALTSEVWFDIRGQVIKSTQLGGLVQKTTYDSLGRVAKTYLTDGGGDSGYEDAGNVTDDTVLSQMEYTYDDNGNVIETVDRERTSDASGTGELGTATTGVSARVTYSGAYYDSLDRLTDTVNVGTNGGTTPWTRPAPESMPTRSDSVLINSVEYDASGFAWKTTDSMAVEYRTEHDLLGRPTKTIENYVNGVVEESDSSTSDDKTTEYQYGPAGLIKIIAWQTSTIAEETEYVYGVSQTSSGISGSYIDSNDIVRETRWPDPTTGVSSSSQKESVKVNALGQVIESTDRNLTVHQYGYDVLGREVSDAVTYIDSGSGVDGSVRLITSAYDTQGNPYLITSYDNTSGGSTHIVNQVQRAFNGLGQLTSEWQQQGAAVNTSSSPRVQYAYSDLDANNRSRLTSMTYPSGYVVNYNYTSGLDSDISRLSSISDGDGTLESYDYLGVGTILKRTNGAGVAQEITLDDFGRVSGVSAVFGSTTLDGYGYTYDRNGNRATKNNNTNSAFDEAYTYDALSQLTGFTRDGSSMKGWDYDAVGNRTSVTTGTGSPVTQTANAQNEITGITGSTAPTYDANGNMTGDETGRIFVYDAWNRLVQVQDAENNPLESYTYDGLYRRVTETADSVTTDLYYSDNWQVLEEQVYDEELEENVTITRFVWSPVYVDALVLRDRDIDVETNEAGERLWVIQDASWNVTAITDGYGVVQERYVYDPYGVVTILEEDWDVKGSGTDFAWTVMFQGMEWDEMTGLYGSSRIRASGYSPTQGRWTSVDPGGFAMGDVNLYRFVQNNPSNYLDPCGLAVMPIINTLNQNTATNNTGTSQLVQYRGGGSLIPMQKVKVQTVKPEGQPSTKPPSIPEVDIPTTVVELLYPSWMKVTTPSYPSVITFVEGQKVLITLPPAYLDSKASVPKLGGIPTLGLPTITPATGGGVVGIPVTMEFGQLRVRIMPGILVRTTSQDRFGPTSGILELQYGRLPTLPASPPKSPYIKPGE